MSGENKQHESKVLYLQKQVANMKRRMNSPKTDLMETSDCYIVRMELPVRSGFDWELKDDSILLVSFEKQSDFLADVNVIYSETKYGKAMRRVKLPSKVNPQPVRNDWENGVWIVEFQKLPKEEVQETTSQVPATAPTVDLAETLSNLKPFEPVTGLWSDE